MTRSEYQPGPPGDADARREDGRWTVVFVRVLPHAPHKVWSALTDPAQLREWAPFDADRDLGTTGEATLTMAGGAEPEALPATVRHAEPARLLEYTWGDDVLRWELEASGSGTRLTLRHTIDDRDWIPSVLAGWHICLDVADRLMAGRPVGRIVADEARDHGWGRLKDAYAERLGIGAAAGPDGGRRSG